MELEECLKRGFPPPGKSAFDLTPFTQPPQLQQWTLDPRVAKRLNGWDSRHHVKPSRCNSDIGRFSREYFDQPKSLAVDGRIVPGIMEDKMGMRSLALNGYAEALPHHPFSTVPHHTIAPGRRSYPLPKKRKCSSALPDGASRASIMMGSRYSNPESHEEGAALPDDLQVERSLEGSWNIRHNVLPSKSNNSMHVHYRNFFDRPTDFGHGAALSSTESQKSRINKNPWALPKAQEYDKAWVSTRVQFKAGYMNCKPMLQHGILWASARQCTAPRSYVGSKTSI